MGSAQYKFAGDGSTPHAAIKSLIASMEPYCSRIKYLELNSDMGNLHKIYFIYNDARYEELITLENTDKWYAYIH